LNVSLGADRTVGGLVFGAEALGGVTLTGSASNRIIVGNANASSTLSVLTPTSGSVSHVITNMGLAAASNSSTNGWDRIFDIGSNATLTVQGSARSSANGNFELIKTGSGRLIWQQAIPVNDPVNGIRVSGGILDLQANVTTVGNLNGGNTTFNVEASGIVTNTSGTTSTVTLRQTSGAYASAGSWQGNLALTIGQPNVLSTSTSTFTGSNSYSGATLLRGGSLFVNGSHTSAGAYTVVDGGVGQDSALGGSGSINAGSNIITIGDGAAGSDGISFLRPGAAADTIGELTLSAQTLSLQTDSILEIDLESASNTSDLLTLVGNLNIVSGATLSLNPLGSFDAATFFDGSSYLFLNYSGSLTGAFGLDVASATLLTANNYELFYDAANTQIVLQAIPEPSAWAGITLAGIAFLHRRRRSERP
jgi:fibronectin-binding autotransporter adhesin